LRSNSFCLDAKRNKKSRLHPSGDPKPQLRWGKIIRSHLLPDYQPCTAATLFCPTPPLYGLGTPPAE
ncbi:hypothetical protein, partial [Dysgonomonas gadei]|uniref:hypothetical protein n=1 Tax=Dysgonomonas gadei TaxID=156974 RepID=UPI001C876F20